MKHIYIGKASGNNYTIADMEAILLPIVDSKISTASAMQQVNITAAVLSLINTQLTTLAIQFGSMLGAVNSTLTYALNSEIARAVATESLLASNTSVVKSSLLAETNARIANISTLNDALAIEIARATGINSSLTAAIFTEISRAIAAESTLSTGLTFETTRATTAETSISSNLGITNLHIDSISANLLSETTNRTAAVANLAITFSANLVNLANNNSANLANLANNNSANLAICSAGLLSLNNSLLSEIQRATGADNLINSNVTVALGAITGLQALVATSATASRIATSQNNTVCNISTIGGIRYNTNVQLIEVCNGTVWLGPPVTPIISFVSPAGLIATIYDSMRALFNYTNITFAATSTTSDPLTYSITAGSLPIGLTLNSSTGGVTGQATAVVSNTAYTFSITVTSRSVYTNVQVFSILIIAPVVSIFSYTGTLVLFFFCFCFFFFADIF